MIDLEIVEFLEKKYGDQIDHVFNFPKAFWNGNILDIKAIYLGCDPSNKHSNDLKFAFAHESDLKIFNSFISSHTAQLEYMGLNWDNVYTQNLCRNYFKEETSKNKIWEKVAKEFWIEELKKELEIFKPEIPVLLTSEKLYQVLLKDNIKRLKAKEIYSTPETIPVSANDNLLGRPIIPLYRHFQYSLNKPEWQSYKERVKALFNN